jgi:hypothetical protein
MVTVLAMILGFLFVFLAGYCVLYVMLQAIVNLMGAGAGGLSEGDLDWLAAIGGGVTALSLVLLLSSTAWWRSAGIGLTVVGIFLAMLVYALSRLFPQQASASAGAGLAMGGGDRPGRPYGGGAGPRRRVPLPQPVAPAGGGGSPAAGATAEPAATTDARQAPRQAPQPAGSYPPAAPVAAQTQGAIEHTPRAGPTRQAYRPAAHPTYRPAAVAPPPAPTKAAVRRPGVEPNWQARPYRDLLALTGNDLQTAIALIEYERKRDPQASQEELCRSAIWRLERDRR